jgi:hypothetical protein
MMSNGVARSVNRYEVFFGIVAGAAAKLFVVACQPPSNDPR